MTTVRIGSPLQGLLLSTYLACGGMSRAANIALQGASNENLEEQMLLQVKAAKDDMIDQDIMEYSAMHAEQNVDDNVFQSGGAILDALAETDPNIAAADSTAQSSSKKTASSAKKEKKAAKAHVAKKV